MEFTRKNFEEFRKDLTAALKVVEEKYQVNIEAGNISYTDNSFSVKLNAYKKGYDTKKTDFDKICRIYGFEPTDYNREFSMDGEIYTLIGFNHRAKKNPCRIVKKKDGREYKCGIDLVRAMLDMQKL